MVFNLKHPEHTGLKQLQPSLGREYTTFQGCFGVAWLQTGPCGQDILVPVPLAFNFQWIPGCGTRRNCSSPSPWLSLGRSWAWPSSPGGSSHSECSPVKEVTLWWCLPWINGKFTFTFWLFCEVQGIFQAGSRDTAPKQDFCRFTVLKNLRGYNSPNSLALGQTWNLVWVQMLPKLIWLKVSRLWTKPVICGPSAPTCLRFQHHITFHFLF